VSDHRLAKAKSFQCVPLRRPFSNFDHVDRHFHGQPAIRRLFSQARSHKAKTLVIEEINAEGIIRAENAEIIRLYSDYQEGGLKRLTFWDRSFRTEDEFHRFGADNLIGYAILKRDRVSSCNLDKWHVFDSVFRKYPHYHNCVPAQTVFSVRAGGRSFDIQGVLYCQQNELNKACAQVALRSLAVLHLPEDQLPYERINRLAAKVKKGKFNPADGLDSGQIRAVLTGLGIGFSDVDYTALPRGERRAFPYQKFLYAGVESGAGALLGFEYKGPKAKGRRHIIPFFGHTFNQDAWVPNAEVAYFHVGERTRYLPSEAWVSSFIGHDDNFGSNFCVPRLYVTRAQAQYVAALQLPEVRSSGVSAEAVAVEYLYSLLPFLSATRVRWLQRLIHYASNQQVVLRALALKKQDYVAHLRHIRDWRYRAENEKLCRAIESFLPKMVWMVEVSVPELFPVNQRKLGEIVLDATHATAPKLDFSTYLIARFPGRFMLLKTVDVKGRPDFISIPSGLQSHTPLYQAHSRTRTMEQA
jgi:hypothetical protein